MLHVQYPSKFSFVVYLIDMSHLYQPTDLVLAKVKGYPAWPAMIVPTELIPEHVLRNRSKQQQPAKRKMETSTGQESVTGETESDENPDDYIVYSSILKFRKFDTLNTQYCVKFLCDDSYIWVKPSDLKPLTVDQCKEWLKKPSSRNKKLIPAYEMASRGSDGIDVWEFIEYGSAGKPDEEEYFESFEEGDEFEEDSGVEYEDEPVSRNGRAVKEKPARASARQRQKRQRENQTDVVRRTTRSKSHPPAISEESDNDLRESEPEEPKTKRSKTKSKGKTSSKPKKVPLVKYKYDDDEDWTIVGLGPQDLSLQKKASPFVNKLSQKKNLEWHLETKLEILDRLSGVNSFFLDILIPSNEAKSLREDYETILDELNLALGMKGARDEFMTLFQSNTELLTCFRLLFNLKGKELKDWGLWDQFQDSFVSIYEHKFIPDEIEWLKDKPLTEDSEQLQDSVLEDQIKSDKLEATTS